MFEHLDDQDPFVPDGALRAAVKRRGGRLRARRRALTAASVTAPAVLLAGSFAMARRGSFDPIERVAIGGIVQQGPDGTPTGATTDDLDQPFTLLAVGTDGERTDTIMLVRVDRPAGAIRIVSLPRDLYVPLAGGPGSAKLNTALGQGRATLIATVNQALGVTIDHYVETGFDGFMGVVDAVGGVPVVVDAPLRDRMTGLAVEPGCQTLDGGTALALARSRSLSVRAADGSWAPDGSADLGRELRQQVLAAAALGRVGRLHAGKEMLPLARALMGHVVADERVDIAQSGELTRWAGTLGPDAIRSTTAAVVPTTVDGASVYALAPGAPASVQAFLRGEPDTRPPAAPSSTGAAPVEAHVRPAPGGAC